MLQRQALVKGNRRFAEPVAPVAHEPSIAWPQLGGIAKLVWAPRPLTDVAALLNIASDTSAMSGRSLCTTSNVQTTIVATWFAMSLFALVGALFVSCAVESRREASELRASTTIPSMASRLDASPPSSRSVFTAAPSIAQDHNEVSPTLNHVRFNTYWPPRRSHRMSSERSLRPPDDDNGATDFEALSGRTTDTPTVSDLHGAVLSTGDLRNLPSTPPSASIAALPPLLRLAGALRASPSSGGAQPELSGKARTGPWDSDATR